MNSCNACIFSDYKWRNEWWMTKHVFMVFTEVCVFKNSAEDIWNKKDNNNNKP